MSECIFQIVNIANAQSNSLPDNYSQFGGGTLFLPDTGLSNRFTKDDDKRRKYLFSESSGTKTLFCEKYKRATVMPNVCIIRLAEMHLIWVEANLSPGGNGNTKEALESYNKIREKRMLLGKYSGTISAKEKKAAVLIHTFLPNDQLKLKAIADSGSISFYLANVQKDTNSTAVVILKGTQNTITAAAFGITDYGTHRYLTAVNNTGKDMKYEVELLFTPETNTDKLLEKIRLERRWELAFEGDRYFNLRRMKQPVRGGISYNDPSLLFKIPQEEIAGNPEIEQNP